MSAVLGWGAVFLIVAGSAVWAYVQYRKHRQRMASLESQRAMMLLELQKAARLKRGPGELAADPNVKPGELLKQKYAGVKEGGVVILDESDTLLPANLPLGEPATGARRRVLTPHAPAPAIRPEGTAPPPAAPPRPVAAEAGAPEHGSGSPGEVQRAPESQRAPEMQRAPDAHPTPEAPAEGRVVASGPAPSAAAASVAPAAASPATPATPATPGGVLYTSTARVEKVGGHVRRAYLPTGDTMTMGVHGPIASYFRLDPVVPLPLPVDYIVAATAG